MTQLGIITPVLGAASETFIRRHLDELYPGRTHVVADKDTPPWGGHWRSISPTFVMGDPLTRIQRWTNRLLGITGEEYRRRLAANFLARRGVSVVLVEWLDFGLPWLNIARERGWRFFGHAHGADVSPTAIANLASDYRQYNTADGLIVPSNLVKNRLAELGIAAGKIHVIPYGVDVTETTPAFSAPGVGRPLRCIAVGRMVPKKAPLITLAAFKAALEKVPDMHLDFVGDGELMSDVRGFVRNMELGTKVTLHGTQPNAFVQELLNSSDLFLQHSVISAVDGDEEGLPVAILEAMAHGLAVVSTRHAGIPEAIEDGKSGMLVDEHDTVGMADAIVCLAKAPELRVGIGRKARSHVLDRYSWSRERKDLLETLGLA